MFKFLKKVFGKKKVKIERICYEPIDENFVKVTTNEKSSIISTEEYEEIRRQLERRLYTVKANDKYRVIDKEGEIISADCERIRIDGDILILIRNGQIETYSL